MRRRLTLLRHGHADEGSDDFSRPLSAAGRAAAAAAGERLRRDGLVPDHVLASPAPRALETAQLVVKSCGYGGAVRAEAALYLAPAAGCLAALRGVPQSARSVLLVGHNPGLSQLASELGASDASLAPAELVSTELELADWAEL